MLYKNCIVLLSCALLFCVTGCSVLTKASETLEDILPLGKSETASVENVELPLSLGFGEKTGLYTGQLLNGVPHGMGKFVATNPEGDPWYYEGEFVEGHFNGTGKIIWNSGNVQEGVYLNDYISFTPLQMFQTIAPAHDFSTVANAEQFLQTNPWLFPTAEEQSVSPFIGEDLTYKTFSQDPNRHGNKLLKLEDLYVGLIEVSYIDQSNPNTKYTRLNLIDKDWNCYRMFYLGEMSEVEVNEKLKTAYALPLSKGGFHNASGGYTSTINCALSFYQQ